MDTASSGQGTWSNAATAGVSNGSMGDNEAGNSACYSGSGYDTTYSRGSDTASSEVCNGSGDWNCIVGSGTTFTGSNSVGGGGSGFTTCTSPLQPLPLPQPQPLSSAVPGLHWVRRSSTTFPRYVVRRK